MQLQQAQGEATGAMRKSKGCAAVGYSLFVVIVGVVVEVVVEVFFMALRPTTTTSTTYTTVCTATVKKYN
jgi:hypothetical protein